MLLTIICYNKKYINNTDLTCISVLIGIQKKSYETLLINYLELCSTTRNIHLLHCEHKIGKYEENETSLVSWKKGLEPRKLKLCEVATTHKLLSKPFSI